MTNPLLESKVRQMREQLIAHAPVLVAYSGGVDSTYLLAAAFQTLGEKVLGVIADSPSLPRHALEEALATAWQIGAPVEVVKTDEFANPDYLSNPPNRCYFCKAELFTKLELVAQSRGFHSIAYGENADDMCQVRPGREAAKQFSVLAPLRDAGLTKAEIRELSQALGLPTADAPAQPCLSSRIPWGTPVTLEALSMVERGEAILRGLGFKVFRVRHLVNEQHPARARVQIAPEEMDRLPAVEGTLKQGLLSVGYANVEIDPTGYQSPN